MRVPRLPDDYAASAVPDERTVGGVQIGLVLVGMGVTVSAFLLAAEAAIRSGFLRGVLASLVAGGVLAAGGAATGYIGATRRVSSYVIIQRTFGHGGAKLVNLFLTLLTFGFYCVLAALLGNALAALARGLGIVAPIVVWTMSGSLLVTVATLYGFKALQKITFVILPVLAAGLVLMAFMAIRDVGFEKILAYRGQGVSFGIAVSSVLGGLIGFVVQLPNLTRFARRGADGVIAAVVGMGIGFPAILIISAIASVAAGMTDITAILAALGLGTIATMLAAISIWKTNVLNLYFSYLGSSTLVPRWAPWQLIIAGGALGGVLGAIDVNAYFMPFLLILGAVAPPIAVIYCIDSFIGHREGHETEVSQEESFRVPALLCWASAAAVGVLATHDVLRVCGIPAIDSVLAAAVLFGGYRLAPRCASALAHRADRVSPGSDRSAAPSRADAMSARHPPR